MTTLPQPPPDAPAPPPSEHARRSRKKFLWILIGIPICCLILLALLAPHFLRSSKKGVNKVQATNNAKQIYMLLVDFDQDYGSFPDSMTASAVEHTAGTKPPARHTSNSLLAQLIIGGFTAHEEIFFAKTKQSRKPDNVTTGGNVLMPGECGFAYLPGFSTADNAEIPILVTPLISGTTKFDRKIHDGKAVILRINGCAQALNIAKDGHVYEANGMDLFDPRQPYWGGKAPVIAYPE